MVTLQILPSTYYVPHCRKLASSRFSTFARTRPCLPSPPPEKKRPVQTALPTNRQNCFCLSPSMVRPYLVACHEVLSQRFWTLSYVQICGNLKYYSTAEQLRADGDQAWRKFHLSFDGKILSCGTPKDLDYSGSVEVSGLHWRWRSW